MHFVNWAWSAVCEEVFRAARADHRHRWAQACKHKCSRVSTLTSLLNSVLWNGNVNEGEPIHQPHHLVITLEDCAQPPCAIVYPEFNPRIQKRQNLQRTVKRMSNDGGDWSSEGSLVRPINEGLTSNSAPLSCRPRARHFNHVVSYEVIVKSYFRAKSEEKNLFPLTETCGLWERNSPGQHSSLSSPSDGGSKGPFPLFCTVRYLVHLFFYFLCHGSVPPRTIPILVTLLLAGPSIPPLPFILTHILADI